MTLKLGLTLDYFICMEMGENVKMVLFENGEFS